MPVKSSRSRPPETHGAFCVAQEPPILKLTISLGVQPSLTPGVSGSSPGMSRFEVPRFSARDDGACQPVGYSPHHELTTVPSVTRAPLTLTVPSGAEGRSRQLSEAGWLGRAQGTAELSASMKVRHCLLPACPILGV